MADWHKSRASREMTRQRSLQQWAKVARHTPTEPPDYEKPWRLASMTKEQRTWIEDTYLKGASLKAIGNAIGCSDVCVFQWLKDWKVPRRGRGFQSQPEIEVPAWVPAAYIEIYDRLASERGEEYAASYVRQAKAGALKNAR